MYIIQSSPYTLIIEKGMISKENSYLLSLNIVYLTGVQMDQKSGGDDLLRIIKKLLHLKIYSDHPLSYGEILFEILRFVYICW